MPPPAGPPATLTEGAAPVPRGASKTAGHSLIACADAAAVAAADQAFAEAAGAASGRSLEAVQDEQRLLRCLLKDVIQASKLKKGDGRVLCYGGQAAAAAAKFGRPMDLRSVAARIDAGCCRRVAGCCCCCNRLWPRQIGMSCLLHTRGSLLVWQLTGLPAPGPWALAPPRAPAGVYSALPSPLAAFAADIRYACSLYQAACNKHNSLFAQEYVDRCEAGRGGR